MDSSQFDTITKRLATGVSRRTLTRGLASGTLGVLGVRAAAAQTTCKLKDQRCSTGTDCCSGRCVRTGAGKRCQKALQQGICTIQFNRCLTQNDPNQLRGCAADGTTTCQCTVTIKGHSRCSDGDVLCAACAKDADCVDFAMQNNKPRPETWRCLSCPNCAGLTTACAASCSNPERQD